MGRRPMLAIFLVVVAGLLASCSSSAPDASVDDDRPVATTEPLRTTVLEATAPTLPADDRPAGVSDRATGYQVPGTDGVWIEPNGDAVVVDCTAADPTPAIRAVAIPGYRGIWTCI